jgi:hypothetical protein
MFTDCRDECAALEDLLQRIRIGESAVLVLRGEARSPSTASFAYPTTRLSRRAEADARVSGRGEFHPPALSEPGVNVSAHRAPIVQPSGRTPNRQWANRSGWRLKTSTRNLRALAG